MIGCCRRTESCLANFGVLGFRAWHGSLETSMFFLRQTTNASVKSSLRAPQRKPNPCTSTLTSRAPLPARHRHPESARLQAFRPMTATSCPQRLRQVEAKAPTNSSPQRSTPKTAYPNICGEASQTSPAASPVIAAWICWLGMFQVSSFQFLVSRYIQEGLPVAGPGHEWRSKYRRAEGFSINVDGVS